MDRDGFGADNGIVADWPWQHSPDRSAAARLRIRTEGTQFEVEAEVLSQQMHSPITIMYAMWETYHVLFLWQYNVDLYTEIPTWVCIFSPPAAAGSFNPVPEDGNDHLLLHCGTFCAVRLVYCIPDTRCQQCWYTCMPDTNDAGIQYTTCQMPRPLVYCIPDTTARKGRTGNEPVRPLTICVLRSIAYNERRDSAARRYIGQH